MVTYILLGIAIILLIALIGLVAYYAKKKTKSSDLDKQLQFVISTLNETQKTNNEVVMHTVKAFQDNLVVNFEALERRIFDLSKMQEEKLENIRRSNDEHIEKLQKDNAVQLDKMRDVVDEKLSKTINERFEETFKVLSQQLESVYKSLGEMKNIASDVGSLTKVLSNVKTTGIFGEVQLGAIFDQVLTSDMYETNFVTGEGREPVEYAIKLPGQNEGEFVYLPVDSKFPFSVYSDLQAAYDNNDFEVVKAKKEQLKNTIRSMAKDISSKYICPPRTTDFGVMFLPVEGLYAEVAKMGLIEELQSKFNVTIAGPTTMSALLSSLQMGFRTLAIQKKSGQVWKILGAVRTEFEKFNVIVEKIQTQFEKTSKDFDSLVGTRSRLLASKLRGVDRLPAEESVKLLDIKDVDE